RIKNSEFFIYTSCRSCVDNRFAFKGIDQNLGGYSRIDFTNSGKKHHYLRTVYFSLVKGQHGFFHSSTLVEHPDERSRFCISGAQNTCPHQSISYSLTTYAKINPSLFYHR